MPGGARRTCTTGDGALPSPTWPLWRFVRSYFFRGNCLDGRFGLVNSVMDAYAAYLKYAYLWDLERTSAPTPPPPLP